MNINFKQCNTTNYSHPSKPRDIQYIVIHYTANNGDTAKNNADYFSRATVQASAHYFVDENEVWQSVLDTDIAWHCNDNMDSNAPYRKKCYNINSIGIEMCSRIDNNGDYYIKSDTLLRTIELTKMLMQKYNIPIDNVIRHHDASGKICPAPLVHDRSLWTWFKNELIKEPAQTPDKYKTISDVPEWAKEAIQFCVDNKIIMDANKLDLSYDMLRIVVMMYRWQTLK